MKQARQKQGAQRQELLQQSEEKLMQAEKKLLLFQTEIKMESFGAYMLACIYALRGNEAECKRWLQVGEAAGTLWRTREEAMEEEAFASMRDKEWFKAIRWKVNKQP